jgi:hypothetical protein
MDVDTSFHYPPDLLELLVDAIPLLLKGKQAVVLFFRGAGVPEETMADVARIVNEDRDKINKYQIARTVLTRVSEMGEIPAYIKIRREILQRVMEWEDYSTCYPENQLKARGAVANICHVVNVVDSFRRMQRERNEERRKHQDAVDLQVARAQSQKQELGSIRTDFYGLFTETDRAKKGKALEGVMNRWFRHSQILVREAFTLRTESGKDLEQIDGAIDIDGSLCLVEFKWWEELIGVPEVNQHISRIFLRGTHVRGIIVAYKGYTESAIKTCKEAINAGATISLCTLAEFVNALEHDADLKSMLRAKLHAALLEKNPFKQIPLQ